MFKSIAILIFSCLFSASLIAQDQAVEKPIVVWAKYDFAPVHINSGEHKGQGISDMLFRFLQSRLPAYQH